MAIDLTEANLQGVGRGAAQVWGTNRALAGLQQQQQQEILRKQKEEIEMADQLAKVSYDGIRDNDLPDVLNKYGELKNTFAKIRGTANQMDRLKLQGELNSQKADFSRVVNNSKDAKAQIAEGYKLRISKPNDVSDFYAKDINDVNNTPTSSPDFQKKVELFGSRALSPAFDEIAMIKKIAPFAVEPVQGKIKSRRIDGGTERFREEGDRLNVNSFTQQIIKQASSNRGLQRYITQAYPNMNIADATLAYAQQRAKDIAPQYAVQEKIVGTKYDSTFAENQEIADGYKRRRFADGISGTAATATFWQDKVNAMIDGKSGAHNFMFDALKAKVAEMGQTVSGRIHLKRENDIIKVTIPPITKNEIILAGPDKGETKTTAIKPEQTFSYNPKDRETSARKLTDIINIYTGANEPYSKQFTQGGKGKVQGGAGSEGFKNNKTPTSYKTTYGTFSEEQLKSQYGDRWKDALKKMQ